tara:strand:- start:2350 stop:3114 length:765 start_codon:yes stop_codon:yes gene_type:complete
MNNQKLFKGVGGIYRYNKLNHSSLTSWRLIWKPICSSTEIELSNWIAQEPIKKNLPRAIFSSTQNFGKGQFGRYWHSPRGGVWVSAAIKIEGLFEKNIDLYGLAIALALVERIERKGVDVKIKWPNDLLVNGKKLAGILPRLIFRGDVPRLLRVGVGLNVFNAVPHEGISLKNIIRIGDQKMNINFWSSEVLFAIERSLDLLDNKKFLCSQVEQRLWTEKFFDKVTHCQWDIKGIGSSGGLILSRGGKERVLTT